jgi:hypothetical protein
MVVRVPTDRVVPLVRGDRCLMVMVRPFCRIRSRGLITTLITLTQPSPHRSGLRTKVPRNGPGPAMVGPNFPPPAKMSKRSNRPGKCSGLLVLFLAVKTATRPPFEKQISSSPLTLARKRRVSRDEQQAGQPILLRANEFAGPGAMHASLGFREGQARIRDLASLERSIRSQLKDRPSISDVQSAVGLRD